MSFSAIPGCFTGKEILRNEMLSPTFLSYCWLSENATADLILHSEGHICLSLQIQQLISN